MAENLYNIPANMTEAEFLKIMNQYIDIEECKNQKQKRLATLHNNLVAAGCYDPLKVAEHKKEAEMEEKLKCLMLNNNNNG